MTRWPGSGSNWPLDDHGRAWIEPPSGRRPDPMKVRAPVLQLSRSLTLPLAQPNARDFKPRPLNFLTKMAPKAEERFQARWEQGRVAYEKACAQWQQAEEERQERLARAKKEHQFAIAATQVQHRRVDELEADFRAGSYSPRVDGCCHRSAVTLTRPRAGRRR